jgi:hypothetical protein
MLFSNFFFIYDIPAYFSYKITYKSIRANRHTDTNETFRSGLSVPFQERVSYFTVYMLLLQDATISKQDVRIGVLESSSLAKPK